MSGVPERPTTTIVVPAYNEEARLASLLDQLSERAEADLAAAGLAYAETVIVDDGSTDATSALLRQAAEDDAKVRPVLGRPVNLGKGAAIREGVGEATGDLVLLADVDLSTPLSDAAGLRAAMLREDAPIAIGSRDVEGSNVEAPWHRRAIGTLFNLSVRTATGLRFSDTQCGFKLIETSVARELFEEQVSRGFAFDVEILVRADLAGRRVVEVPVTYLHDDRSKVRVLRSSLSMSRDLLRIARLRRAGRRARATHPPGA